jgi:uncharacterized protein (DUF362 family)
MMAGEARADRREALVKLLRLGGLSAGAAGLAVWLNSRGGIEEAPVAAPRKPNFGVPADARLPKLVVSQGDGPRQLVRAAVQELGGMRRFVAHGDVVAIKPNIAWDRTPQQAANTNPEVVAETVRLCMEAGAKEVIVTDVPVHDPLQAFERSGIAEAARAEGARVILPESRLFREVDLHGSVLSVWPVLEPFLAADKLINIPIAKQHNLTGASLGMKNWFGILGGSRERLHQRIHESLADLADYLRPTLTILDAWRVLMRNGPTGGSLADVELRKTIVAGTDPVAVDAYAAKAYWNLDAAALPYLKLAADRGLGTTDFESLLKRVASRQYGYPAGSG